LDLHPQFRNFTKLDLEIFLIQGSIERRQKTVLSISNWIYLIYHQRNELARNMLKNRMGKHLASWTVIK